MSESIDDLDQRLIAGYRQQAIQYEYALRLIADTTRVGDWAHRLNEALGLIAELDAALADDKAAWRRAARTPGPALRAVLDSVGERIQSLAKHIDERVASLMDEKKRLVPQIDEFVRQRAMLNAYEQCSQAAHA